MKFEKGQNSIKDMETLSLQLTRGVLCTDDLVDCIVSRIQGGKSTDFLLALVLA